MNELPARNLIGGQWRFPAGPFEFEIRNPADGTVSAVVPLSSRFDLTEAIGAARAAVDDGTRPWAPAAQRWRLLDRVLNRMISRSAELAQVQATETGLSAQDSHAVLAATLDQAGSLLRAAAADGRQSGSGGVSGHVLSWGLPFTEIITSVWPSLLCGASVVVKPSLRGALTPVSFGLLTDDLPDGVVNIVQGTGVDVGADLIGRRELTALYVRAGERTRAQARRARERTGVPLHTLRAGGNVLVLGPDGGPDLDLIAGAVAGAVRIHNAGGPYGLPLLAVHRELEQPVLDAVVSRLSGTLAAPLPTEPLRQRAVRRINALLEAGATAVLGGPGWPDDAIHRMGWRLPPTVLRLGSPASVRVQRGCEPLGPVLGVITWSDPGELAGALTGPRSPDGTAVLCGVEPGLADRLPHGRVVPVAGSEVGPLLLGAPGMLPETWTRVLG